MKNIFLLFFLVISFSSWAQINNYEKEWAHIDTLEHFRRIDSAIIATNELMEKSSQDSSNPVRKAHYIKAFIFNNKYKIEKDLKLHSNWEKLYCYQEILERLSPILIKKAEKSDDPVIKALLYSNAADVLMKYQNNFYTCGKIADRKYQLDRNYSIEHQKTKDAFRDSINQIYKELQKQTYDYLLLATQFSETKKIPAHHFQILLEKAEFIDTTTYRFSLYDLLVDNAIWYLRSHSEFTPYYKNNKEFPYRDSLAFSKVSDFIKYDFATSDPHSLRFEGYRLYQELLRTHLNSGNRAILAKFDFERMQFARQYGSEVINRVDGYYLSRLIEMEQSYADLPISSMIAYDIGSKLIHRSYNDVLRTKFDHRFNYAKANNICQAAIKRHPTSIGANNCQMLMNNIRTKNISLSIEAINPIDKPILAEINSRNIDKIYCKLLKLPSDYYKKKKELNLKKYKPKRDSLWHAYINDLEDDNASNWEIKVPHSGDFKAQSFEIDIPKQQAGGYLLLLSHKEDFKYEENGLIYAYFQVSDLAFIARGRNIDDSYGEFFILDRNNGAAKSNATISFLDEDWNLIKTCKSEENGHATTEGTHDNKTFSIRIEKENDFLFLDDANLYFNSYSLDDDEERVFLYTDRSIYRPGQTVYFKGLLTNYHNNGLSDVLANEETTITLYDVNGQEIESVDLITSKFGSFSGSFKLPTSGLLGKMSLEDDYTGQTIYFRVEEYKKPTFEASLSADWYKGKTIDTLYATGIAKTFSKMPLAGAEVSYFITKSNGDWYYAKKDTLVVSRTAINNKGAFNILLEVPIEQDTFVRGHYYTIEADIVDISGETHPVTFSTFHKNDNYMPWTRKAERKAALANININLWVQHKHTILRTKKTELAKITLNANKGNGDKWETMSEGELIIERYQQPLQPQINRFWSIPDTAVWSMESFKAKFPLYDFKKNERARINWPMDTIYTEKWSKTLSKKLILNTKKWQKGSYRLIVHAKDSLGESYNYQSFFVVNDVLHVPNYNQAIALYNAPPAQFKGEPGDTILLKLGSYFDDAHILLELENHHRVDEYRWLQPGRYQEVPIVLKEKHRGNLHLRFLSVYNNRYNASQNRIHVPWSNKKLTIEYLTFRDNLLPGQEEEWTIKISGPEGEAVAAEVLASMYDAALDQLAHHSWSLDVYRNEYHHSLPDWSSKESIKQRSFGATIGPNWQLPRLREQHTYYPSIASPKSFLEFNTHWYLNDKNSDDWDNDGIPNHKDLEPYTPPGNTVDERGVSLVQMIAYGSAESASYSLSSEDISNTASRDIASLASRVVVDAKPGSPIPPPPPPPPSPNDNFGEVKVRSNLKETVFFYPHLKTEKDGSVAIKFTMSEALSKWKFMAIAHTEDLKTASSSKMLITQKKLMVMPSTPRFLRQADEVVITSKISNLSKEDLTGKITLQLFDAQTEESVDAAFSNQDNLQDFELKQGDVTKAIWKIKIPATWTAPIMYRIIAKSGNFSDGEQNNLPVISNKALITEAMPILSHGKSKQDYTFNSLKNNDSKTLKHHQLSLELTPNPAWDALLSLPYLMEYPYECSEQLFSRFYANSLATQIVHSTPKIKAIFESWAADSSSVKSLDKLLANPKLKSAILEETPWVLNSTDNKARQKQIGQLFNLTKMAEEFEKVKSKLVERQASDGGFAWFNGGSSSSFISQYIVGGFGKLERLGANPLSKDKAIEDMLNNALHYMDQEIIESYNRIRSRYKNSTARKKDKDAIILEDNLGYNAIQYLYAKSYFWKESEILKDSALTGAIHYFLKQANFHWRNKSTYHKGMLALAMHRMEAKNTLALAICDSLKSQAIIDKDQGMYWQNSWGYYWYQLPIETQAMMIEVFDEVAKDEQAVYDLKLWLLQNKKGKAWPTTKATTTACYALLMSGKASSGDDKNPWLNEGEEINIILGGKQIDQSEIKKEAGTGYFQKSWTPSEITKDMANLTLENPNSLPAFGAMFWQYFEEYDQVKSFKDTPLKIKKELFVQTKTLEGNKNTPIENTTLKAGDLILVRIELEVEADMEYVHMKDMRAAGFEPINVLSGYKYNNGLGYYEMTKDASSNFFFSYLRKGKYVFEYPLRAVHGGDYSNGITTIQSMYAPEFTSHSEGIRVKVE